ncbi:hypothetical protein QFC22_000504 [Naganishia vaughanmartiniae]|uniref:Uncharacterized protein n=1 Tax=Naganishia vaughanmartiniae TaxID=1424756 RepID=A0ACC2XNJ0_9TREE|nr:hypothetical protein QFC22_000504 [Naganishia vaughanmartiniae]
MNGSHADRLTPQSTPRKGAVRARSRATSSSSIITSATSSLYSTPIKVPVVSSTSQPEISDDYANANLYSGDGEAVPQLQRTVSDLALACDTSPVTSSTSSPPREPFHRHHTYYTDAEISFPDLTRQSLLGSIPQRKPLGSRRSTISASATTTSLNLEIADSVTVCSIRKGAADLLSQTQSLERKVGPERVNETVAAPSSRKGVSPASIRKRRNEDAATESHRQGRASTNDGATANPQLGSPNDASKQPTQDKEWPAQSSYPERRYFILTSAGKPVFCSHAEDEESLTRMMGVAQAIISIYDEDGDKLRSIAHGRTKITFLLADPLYLFCVSDWKEPEFVTHIITSIEGSEPFLHNLISQLQFDFAFFTSSLQPLRMSPFLREAAASALVPPTKISNLLYVLLVVDNKIVTLLRPRKHSIHPTDLHLLLNVLSASPALRTSETWLPICLPKFNPDGFVYAFISYVRPEVGLVFVSADKEGFEPLREWRDSVVKKLEHAKVLNKIENAHLHHEYSLSDLDTPGHIYDGIHAKSGQLAPLKQFYVRTAFEACMGWVGAFYLTIHSPELNIIAKCIIVFFTQSTTTFELYLTVSPEMPKHSVVSAANAIVRWIGKEESRLFLRDAPVF